MTGIGGDVPLLLDGFASECIASEGVMAQLDSVHLTALQPFQAHRLTVVDLACKEHSASFYSGDHHERQNVEVKFGDFLDYFSASIRGESHWLGEVAELQFYLCQCPIGVFVPDETCTVPVLPEVMELFKVPRALSAVNVSQVNLWMAVKSSRTGIHYDSYRNVLVVLQGQKKVTLYPPSQARNLYPHPIYSRSTNHSSVNFVDPDLSVHPDFGNAESIVMNVQAGSALYIPEGWWHQVDSAPHTVAINYWFEGLRNLLVRNADMRVYYARVIMEDIVRTETARALQQLHRAMPASSSSSKSFSATTLVSTVNSREARENVLMSMPPEDLKRVQIELATQFPSVWRDLLTGSSVDFAAFLTDSWDREEGEPEWVNTLFAALGEDADETKHHLLTKQEQFKQKICTQVVAATFGN